ncbi:hypothetical protein, partial [Herbaspirillum sp.]|uniref:hypothetical protein n=1 Tax=Herbaspirillum sp. TaxID=1890675 RepID=UPI0025869221
MNKKLHKYISEKSVFFSWIRASEYPAGYLKKGNLHPFGIFTKIKTANYYLKDGYEFYQLFETEDDHIASYLADIREEHQDITDARMLEYPNSPYNGNKRICQWQDEMKRRGIA